MKLSYPQTLIPTLKNKHLLLDTNIIRDAVNNPNVYNNFFNELKRENITIATIDFVRYEILKGAKDKNKYEIKEKFLNEIIDTTINIIPDTYKNAYELIKMYGENGAGLHITDLMLGSILLKYQKNIYLITRDTTDFIQDIFNLCFIVNASFNKGIFAYGVFQYNK